MANVLRQLPLPRAFSAIRTVDGIEDNRDFFYGDWVGTQLSYRFPVPHFGSLTVGAEGQFDLRALQQDIDVKPHVSAISQYRQTRQVIRAFLRRTNGT